MCAACGRRPVVTFHHFTTPRWVAAQGGWTEPATAIASSLLQAPRHLGDLVDRACTLNEPNVVANFGYRWGLFPPGKRDADLHRRASDVFIAAHRKPSRHQVRARHGVRRPHARHARHAGRRRGGRSARAP
jgi:beta-glucosidase